MAERSEPPNIRYEALQELGPLRYRVQITQTNPDIRRVTEAFRRNLERILDLGLLPVRLFDWGYRNNDLRRDIAESVRQIIAGDDSGDEQLIERFRSLMDTSGLDEERLPMFHRIINAVASKRSDYYLTKPDPQIPLQFVDVELATNFHHHGEVIALMSSMIVGAWTSHEVLTADLWEACLNARPRLGFVAMNAEPTPGDDEETRDKKERVKFEIPAHLLRLWHSNLHRRMGSLLKRRWLFSRRERAVDAYYKAFPDHKAKLKPILEHQGLRWVAATRNAIVHNGGIAEVEFTSLVRTHPVLGAIREDEEVPIDGKLVVEFVEVVVGQSLALIGFADDFLAEHRD
jgi:hypothetical protein